MSRILITGGAGFIGSHLVDKCLRRGYNVVVLDNFSTGKIRNKRAKIIEGDVRNIEDVRTAGEKCSVVFHLAAMPSIERSFLYPRETSEVNLMGTINILEAARDVGQKVIFASSSSIYGGTKEKSSVETKPLSPKSIYASQKYTGELFCRNFAVLYGLKYVCLRYFNVYGPFQRRDSAYSAVIPAFIDARARNIPAIIYGDGKQSRDFTYVGDVVEATVRAAESSISCGAYNVGTGKTTNLLELHEIVGSSISPMFLPARAGDVKKSQANISKMFQDFKWSATVSLKEGIEEMMKKEMN